MVYNFMNSVTVLVRNTTRKSLRSPLRRSYAHPSSIDPQEIEFFSRLSSQWWDEQGEFAMLHRMNLARMGFIRNKLAQCFDEEATKEGLDQSLRTSGRLHLLQGMNVLDIGCGGGLLSEVSCESRRGNE